MIDDDMLKLAVGEQGPQEEAGQLAKQEGILFKDVISLQLDFQSEYPPGMEQGSRWGLWLSPFHIPAPAFHARSV